ncbi:MAG: hypothetical protein IJX05_05940 [Clostridia bacterium]|nr:hypothetical protein [Clostridia bacterium]
MNMRSVRKKLNKMTVEQLLKTIIDIKSSIDGLKDTMEHPKYYYKWRFKLRKARQLKFYREYLIETKRALAEKGFEYVPDDLEQIENQFNESLDKIKTITLKINDAWFMFCKNISIRILENSIQKIVNERNSETLIVSKEDFLSSLYDLHLGEWRESYYGWGCLDGYNWELIVEWTCGEKISYYGSNSFPYNLNELIDLFDCRYEAQDIYR